MTETLWAPWRMDYIQGKREPGCIFCDFAVTPPEGRRAKLVLAVTEHALVCMNRYPFNSSHLLVAPKRHVSSLAALSLDEYVAYMTLARDAAARLEKATTCEGMNVGMNLGKVAGAGIADHLHTHLVPRWVGDSNFMPVIADVRVMPQYLDETWAKLAPFFDDVAA
jgi:ATP adenylyltransferase